MSTRLVILFAVSVIGIIAVVNLAAALAFSRSVNTPAQLAGILIVTSLVTLIAIVLAAAFRMIGLRGGGGVVARELGGVLVPQDTADPQLRRLRNVVEEIAIASGTPVPEIYLLPHENGINAFAAGWSTSDAAVAVTRGALERLNRAELQGVIAHEFSHILNGDMSISLRLMGLLFGLLVIALIGRTVLRFSSRSSSNRKGGIALIALAAVAVMILGYAGVFFGRLIQAAVSRQREGLADASAVQFTREPEGLKGALVKIGGFDLGSKLQSVRVDEVAHMLFAPGMARLFATHPPLIERIRALDPSFQESEFARVDSGPQLGSQVAGEQLTSESLPELDAGVEALTSPVAAQPRRIAQLVGNPGTPQVRVAQALAQTLPAELLTNLEAPGRALGMLLALVLDRKEEVRARQLEIVKANLGERALGLIEQAQSAAAQLEPFQRLPMLQTLSPSLRRLTRESRARIIEGLERLIRVDGRIEIFEYALGTLARIYLQDELQPAAAARVLKIDQVTAELQTVFSTLAGHGTSDEAQARRAYEIGMHHLLPEIRPPYRPIPGWAPALDRALKCIDALAP